MCNLYVYTHTTSRLKTLINIVLSAIHLLYLILWGLLSLNQSSLVMWAAILSVERTRYPLPVMAEGPAVYPAEELGHDVPWDGQAARCLRWWINELVSRYILQGTLYVKTAETCSIRSATLKRKTATLTTSPANDIQFIFTVCFIKYTDKKNVFKCWNSFKMWSSAKAQFNILHIFFWDLSIMEGESSQHFAMGGLFNTTLFFFWHFCFCWTVRFVKWLWKARPEPAVLWSYDTCPCQVKSKPPHIVAF